MSTRGDGAESDCLSQVVAGGLTNGGPGGASGTLYVPLRLDGAQSRLDGWLEARTTDGEVVAVDLFSGGVSSHGAYVRVDQDGHITR